jgi:hypothetical protein
MKIWINLEQEFVNEMKPGKRYGLTSDQMNSMIFEDPYYVTDTNRQILSDYNDKYSTDYKGMIFGFHGGKYNHLLESVKDLKKIIIRSEDEILIKFTEKIKDDDFIYVNVPENVKMDYISMDKYYTIVGSYILLNKDLTNKEKLDIKIYEKIKKESIDNLYVNSEDNYLINYAILPYICKDWIIKEE